MKKFDFQQHGKPMTRRELLSRGLIAGTGFVLAPTLGTLLSSTAEAQAHIARTPFLVFDLAGGAALPANFLVGKSGGPEDLLKSYSNLGWNPRKTQIDSRFGLPMADASVSKILSGMLSVMSAGAQSNFRMGSFLHSGLIDTSLNPLSAISLVSNSGVMGERLPRALGTRATLSGGNSKPALESESYRPLSVNKLTDLIEAMGLTANFSVFSDSTLKKLVGTLKNISTGQLAKALGTSSSSVLDEFNNKHESVLNNLTGTNGLDPRQDSQLSTLYGINAQTPINDPTLIRAGIVNSVLKGISGPGAITIDGCDYHDGTQSTGDKKDLEIGIEIGRAIESAHLLGTSLFIQVITDGGIYPSEGSRNWQGDSNETCMSVVGYYNPKGPVSFINNRKQIGSYTDSQGADRTTLIGDSPILAAYSAFANYLQVDGRVSEFDKFATGVFSKSQVESVLIFEG